MKQSGWDKAPFPKTEATLGTPDVKFSTASIAKEMHKHILYFPDGRTENQVLFCLH